MIPIFLIAALINAVLCFTIVRKLKEAEQRSPAQSAAKRFASFHRFFGFAWIFWSLVYFMPNTGGQLVLDTVAYALLLLSAAWLVQVPLLVLKQNSLALGAAALEGFVAVVYSYGRLIEFRPMFISETWLFYMWLPTVDEWLIYLTGLSTALAAIALAATFYVMSRHSTEEVRQKSSYLAVGQLVLLTSAIWGFLVTPYQNTILAYALASYLVTIGLIFTFFAISHFDVE